MSAKRVEIAKPKGARRIETEEGGANVTTVPVSKIVEADKFRLREELEDIDSLKEDIKLRGQTTPLFVRAGGNGFYELISGYRRTAALKAAKIPEALVRIYDLSDEDAYLLAASENLQREDLTPYETVQIVAKLDEQGYSDQDIAHKSGWGSRRNVQHYLTVAKAPDEVKKALRKCNDRWTFSHVLEVAKLAKRKDVLDYFGDNGLGKFIKGCIEKDYSVRELKDRCTEIAALAEGKERKKRKKDKFDPARFKEHKKGFDLVIKCRTKRLSEDYSALHENISNALKRLEDLHKAGATSES